jgi:hypothetical protein
MLPALLQVPQSVAEQLQVALEQVEYKTREVRVGWTNTRDPLKLILLFPLLVCLSMHMMYPIPSKCPGRCVLMYACVHRWLSVGHL